MNQTLETLVTRRSVRAYDGRQPDDETLGKIVEAGLYAASGMNCQATKLVVCKDIETVELMSKLNAAVLGSDNDPFYGAKTVIVVFADRNRFTAVEDGSLVMGNLMNAAHSLGVDSCWIHRAKEVFEGEQGRALKAKWGLGDEYVGIGNCALGHRKGDAPEAKPRKEGRIINVSQDLPKSFIICRENGEHKIYICQFSPMTIIKRTDKR